MSGYINLLTATMPSVIIGLVDVSYAAQLYISDLANCYSGARISVIIQHLVGVCTNTETAYPFYFKI